MSYEYTFTFSYVGLHGIEPHWLYTHTREYHTREYPEVSVTIPTPTRISKLDTTLARQTDLADDELGVENIGNRASSICHIRKVVGFGRINFLRERERERERQRQTDTERELLKLLLRVLDRKGLTSILEAMKRQVVPRSCSCSFLTFLRASMNRSNMSIAR